MSDNNNQPAFPILTWDQLESGQIVQSTGDAGLSKREIIAAMAMQGILAKSHAIDGITERGFNTIVADSIMFADALIAELSKD